MNHPIAGSVLLVGEGDFSLSVSLENYLTGPCMTATCLLNEEEIAMHKNALANISTLRQAGVTVLFGVDATCLHGDKRLKDKLFDRIIFNFPHIGGKSHIKKNRTLLKEFFCSAVHILQHDGEVCVTLAKGQGGTPDDKPQREWSNSWQIVAMAVYADLILVKVVPFVATDYPQYTCTGFRSQDKHFNTSGAVTHIFRKSLPLCPPQPGLGLGLVTVEQHNLWTNKYVAEKIIRYKEMTVQPHHPTMLTWGKMQTVIKMIFHYVEFIEQSSLLCHLTKDQYLSNNYTGYILIPTDVNPTSEETHKQKSVNEDELNLTENEEEIICQNLYGGIHSVREAFVLRSSMIKSLLNILKGKDTLKTEVIYFCKGDCYKRGRIKAGSVPVGIEVALCVNTSYMNLGDFTAHIQGLLENMLPDGKRINCIQKSGQSARETDYAVIFIEQESAYQHDHCLSTLEDTSDILGYIDMEIIKHLNMAVCNIYLDKLTCLIYGIKNCKLLWSDDPNYFEQFKGGNKEVCHNASNYSLYPPKWTFDVSFWENQSVEFDELIFNDIFRDYAGDTVDSLDHIGSYKCTDTGKKARCYRHVYRSCDKALSYHMAHDIQKYLRLVTEKQMGITLR